MRTGPAPAVGPWQLLFQAWRVASLTRAECSWGTGEKRSAEPARAGRGGWDREGETGDVAGGQERGVWQPSGDSLGKRKEQSSVSPSVPGGRGSGQSRAGP